MSHSFSFNSSFHSFLLTIDQEFIAKSKENGCPHCGGKLHQANYPRSPFGVTASQRHYYELRLSLCCSNCRKRLTPPSVRFFGRRWFSAPCFILISLLTQRINERRIQQIKRQLGFQVSLTTWKRWRRWWREQFVRTRFWLQAKGLLKPNKSCAANYPRAFLRLFPGRLEEKIQLLLRFLSPMTAGFLRAV